MFELKRKAIHFLGLSVPLLYCTAGKEITLVFVGIAAGCALLMEIGRFKWERFNEVVFQIVGRYAREHEQSKVTGATYYAVAAFLAVGFFSQWVAISSLLFLTLGDSAASIVGTRYGHHKIFEKSVEGSVACLAVCTVIGWILLKWVGLSGALAATVIELLPIPVDDNLRIPVAAGGLMQLLLQL